MKAKMEVLSRSRGKLDSEWWRTDLPAYAGPAGVKRHLAAMATCRPVSVSCSTSTLLCLLYAYFTCIHIPTS